MRWEVLRITNCVLCPPTLSQVVSILFFVIKMVVSNSVSVRDTCMGYDVLKARSEEKKEAWADEVLFSSCLAIFQLFSYFRSLFEYKYSHSS